MAKQLMVVFQDCYKCGPKERWASLQKDVARKNGYELVETPFYKTGADELIRKAAKKGYGVPFITDGEYFAYNVIGLLDEMKEAKKTATKRKTTRKKTMKRKTKKAEKVMTEPEYIEVGDGASE